MGHGRANPDCSIVMGAVAGRGRLSITRLAFLRSAVNECHEGDLQKHMEVVMCALQWRWFFIDGMSMVSAKLLDEIDVKLR